MVERNIGLLLEPLGRAVVGGIIDDGEVVDTDPAVVVEELADPDHLVANAGDQHDRLGAQIGTSRGHRLEVDREVLWRADINRPQTHRQRDHAASESERRTVCYPSTGKSAGFWLRIDLLRFFFLRPSPISMPPGPRTASMYSTTCSAVSKYWS